MIIIMPLNVSYPMQFPLHSCSVVGDSRCLHFALLPCEAAQQSFLLLCVPHTPSSWQCEDSPTIGQPSRRDVEAHMCVITTPQISGGWDGGNEAKSVDAAGGGGGRREEEAGGGRGATKPKM